jgi:RecA/RadA recombinase
MKNPMKAIDLSFPLLSTQNPQLNEFLDGGFPLNDSGIIEFVGESGSGKTLLCLSLSLSSQLPISMGGSGRKGVCFISTEGQFPIERLVLLSQRYNEEFIPNFNFLDNIHISNAFSLSHLESLIFNHLELFLREKDVGLLIIDSITSNFRFSDKNVDGNFPITERNFILHKIASHLKYLSFSLKICIICTNQQTFSSSPALGMFWSNMINMRISFNRNDSRNRWMEIAFCPYLNTKRIFFFSIDEYYGIIKQEN